MRALLLSLPSKLQILIVVGSTVLSAFIIAAIFGTFFDAEILKLNTDLISAVYEVMGTVYAILLTFTLWGVWQSYTEADSSVQNETFALLDLVHNIELTPQWSNLRIHETALAYSESVIKNEWGSLRDISNSVIDIRQLNHSTAMKMIHVIQSIQPKDGKELTIFSHALTLLDKWLDARRARILMARGNNAKALWPLLVVGSFVLFAFHGLFAAQTILIWSTLLGGTALVIGLTFYLIFTLDSPFSGYPSVDAEPFHLAHQLLQATSVQQTSNQPA